MKTNEMLRLVLLSLILIFTACVRGDRPTSAAELAAEPISIQQAQAPATTIQSFTQVEGVDLNARLEAARTRSRGNKSPYWSAWAFDVRPGIAVDPTINEFHGSMNTIGDTSIFIGTTASGQMIETRNLAIFVLRDSGGTQVTRVEIYNLEKKREYSSYPVYWLGRGNNQESLNYLGGLAEGMPTNLLAERATLAIALHDDARVAGLLKNFVRSSSNMRVRSSAIYWLGLVGGEQAFLADMVRNRGEDLKLRQKAAYAIGESHDRTALATIQGLYDTMTELEIRHSLLRAAGNNEDRDAASAFLLKVARNDQDRDTRRAAIRQLGEFDRETLVDELMKLYTGESDVELRRSVLRVLSEMKNQRAQARLLEVARTDANVELRRSAIRLLGERGEAAIDDLLRLYDGEQSIEVQLSILRSLGEIKSERVEAKLFQVASADGNVELRRHAIRALGERAGQRSLKFLADTAEKADGNQEVQLQAVRAISERSKDEAVPILIRIARTHANPAVRRQAIRILGESGDPRAVEFFREVLAKEKS